MVYQSQKSSVSLDEIDCTLSVNTMIVVDVTILEALCATRNATCLFNDPIIVFHSGRETKFGDVLRMLSVC